MKQFWMVVDSTPGEACFFRHGTKTDASEEAERLTIKEGRPFVVLESVAVCEPPPKVIWGIPSTRVQDN